LSRIVWEKYVNVEMWIQFMFHLSAVCDKVQSFVATVTLKQGVCNTVYMLYYKLLKKNFNLI
jgi:hypothetical protein